MAEHFEFELATRGEVIGDEDSVDPNSKRVQVQ
jgi:hypothetical protein